MNLPSFRWLKNQICNKKPLVSQISKCITLCKTPEANWLKISDVVRGTQLDHQFFSRVDLIQIIQEVLNGPSSIWSCRTRKNQLKPPLKNLCDVEGPQNRAQKNITTLTQTGQPTNMSPQLNTHDSIDQINQLKLSIKSINRNYIAIIGATQIDKYVLHHSKL